MTQRKLIRRAQEAGTFSVIPDEVLFDLELSGEARVLYTFVLRKSYKTGSCRMSTEQLAKFLGRSTRQISRYLRELYARKHLIRFGGKRYQRLVPSRNLECFPDLYSDKYVRKEVYTDRCVRYELLPNQTNLSDRENLIGHIWPIRKPHSDISVPPIDTPKKTYTENSARGASSDSSRASPQPPRARSGVDDQILADVAHLRRARHDRERNC